MAFHLLHERCGSRIQNRSYCPVCNVAVPREELVRGFEFVKDEYVRITDEGLKAFESQDGRVIDVREFLPIDTVDPVYFDRTSYLGPGKGGEQGYQLLRHAMAKTGRVTVPKYTMRGKQRLVLLRPVGEGFHLHTLYYADEVADFAEVERPDVRVKPGELELAVRLIEDLAQAEFRPEQYADEYRVRVRAVVERKRAGGTMGATEPQTPPTTVDLVATLKKSLEARRPLAKAGRERTGPEEACSTTKGAIVPITPRSESLRRLVRAPSRWIKVPDRAFREGPPLGDNNSDIFRTQCDLARLNPDFEP